MRRRLLNLLTLLSLMMCVAAGFAWARGYFHSDAWDYGRVAFQGTRMTTEAYDVHCARGGLSGAWGYGQSAFRSPAEADEVRGRMGPTDGCFRFRASELTWLQYAGGFYQQAGGFAAGGSDRRQAPDADADSDRGAGVRHRVAYSAGLRPS